MSPQDSREATLQSLVRAARAEPPAELDWSRVEQRLLRQVQHAPPPAAVSPQALAWAVLTAAALVAIWLIGTQRPTPLKAPTAQSSTTDAPSRNGDAFALGTRVTTTDRPITVQHAGRASWTLSPGSSAVLAGKGERISVRLERGSVLSEVVPNPKPETFVIEAAGARVAVHGTVFRVALVQGRVEVAVSAGTVAVGPLAGAARFLLPAPARGDFAADGLSGSIDDHRSIATPEPRAVTPKPPRAQLPSGALPAPATASAPSVELPREPSINDIELGIVRVVDVASDCFVRHIPSADGVQVTVRTALSLRISAAGAASNVDFQPPLSPEAERCAREGISRIAFAASQEGASVTRLLELKR